MKAMKPKLLLVFIGALGWQVCGPTFSAPLDGAGRVPLASGFGQKSPLLDRRSVYGRPSAVSPVLAESKDSSGLELVREGGLFVGYFGFQTGMAFLMKQVLSKVQVAKGLFGVPAPFFVVSTQQTVSFCIILSILAGSRLIGRPLRIKRLELSRLGLVFALSLCFSLNTGFNLLAMSLIPLSLLLIIRACSPITTSLIQSLLLREKQGISPPEWLCLSAGVVCAAVVTLCESGGAGGGFAAASSKFWLGVLFAITSLLLAGLDFVIKAKLGKGKQKLSAIETNFYNALPVVLITLIVGSLLPTPAPDTWAAKFGSPLTDLQVFRHLFEVNASVFKWVAATGIAAFAFNLYVTFLVVKLSPATSSFAGNFNKSVGIVGALLFFEGNRPHDVKGYLKFCAVFGNIVAFTAYNIIKKRRQKKQKEESSGKDDSSEKGKTSEK